MSLFDKASLIVTPNAYKESKLYSIVPTNGTGDLSVVRATTATRVNSAGLIEDAPYNLLAYSEDFSNGYWTKSGVSVISNDAIAPNGTMTASRLTRGVSSNRHLDRSITLNNFSYSIYAKKGTGNLIRFVSLSGTSDVFFNLLTGTYVLSGVGYTASMENMGNDWYRCSVNGVSNTTQLRFYPGSIDGEYIYIWGAQANLGSVIKEYFKTTDRLNVPRLDYTNSTCPSILVEPQRTNLALRSEEFDNVYWVKTASTVTANQVNSPNGTLTAERLKDTATTSEHNIEKQITITAGTNTFSIFAKKDNNRYFEIGVVNTVNSSARFIFDFDTKAITSFGAIGAIITYVSSSVTELTDGWFRLSLTYTSNTTNPFFVAGLSNSPNVGTTNLVSYLGDGTKGVYIWGAQVETGANATSYIPTTTATVTRNADVISKTGISSLIGQTEGTVYAEFTPIVTTDVVNLSADGVFQTDVNISYDSNNRRIGINLYISPTYIIQYFSPTNSAPLNTKIKVAFGYKSGDLAIYINGVQRNISTSTYTIVTPLTRIRLNQNNFTGNNSVLYNSILVFKTRLSNIELEQLTTL